MSMMEVAEELGKSHGLIAALQGVEGLLEEHNQFAQKHFEGDDLVRYQECYLDALETHFKVDFNLTSGETKITAQTR